MESRHLGATGLTVSEMGLGCMGLTGYYTPSDEGRSEQTLHRAVDLGVTLFDTSDFYSGGRNEEFIGRTLEPVRDRVIIATKFGLTPQRSVDGSPRYVRAACEASLRRLRTDCIDLYFAHRIDPAVPIEETVGAMADLVTEGKVRHLGLCEASVDTLRRAHAVHPLAAVQSEWSLWTRDIEADVLGAARALGIGIVPYSPLGRGFLTGAVTPQDIRDGDRRKGMPRFEPDTMAANEHIVQAIRAMADRKGCTPSQIALAWVLAQGRDVVPIPGTQRVAYLEQNVGAAHVTLSQEDLAECDALLPPGVAVGERYPDGHSYGDTPPVG